MSERWLEECLVNPEIVFLNTGTLAPTLKSAFEASYDLQKKWMMMGPGASLEIREARTYLNMMEEQDKSRRVMATWLNVSPESIALLGNATDGINAALQSIDWQVGDRILTTDEEHEALRYPITKLKNRFGVEVDVVTFPKNDEQKAEFIKDFQKKINNKTKMIALSEVSHRSGIRLPMSEVLMALHSFPEIYFLVDGSHAAGTVLNVIQPGIDFYVFPGHKWLFGPVGTGVLWVSERVLKYTDPLMSGSPMISAEGIRYDSGEGAWRYEHGTRDWSKLVGLTVAVQFRQQWSEHAILSHYELLCTAFISGFVTESDIAIQGKAPILSFQTNNGNQISNTLWESKKIIVKPQDENIRISIPPWIHNEQAFELGQIIGRVTKTIDN